MTNITIRVDETIKQEAETLFEKLGLTVSGAINVFLRQSITEQAIPFTIRTKSREEKYDEYFNPYNMKILLKSIADADAGKLTEHELIEVDDE